MIIFYYGLEAFQPERLLKTSVTSFLAEEPSSAGPIRFDCGEDVTLGGIEGALGAQSLFATKQLIIIENFFSHFAADEQRMFKDTLENYAGEDTIVLWEKGVPRKNATLFTWLLKNAAEVKEFTPLSGSGLTSWIVDEAKVSGGHMSSGVAALLASVVDGDLARLVQEIAKISAYAKGRDTTADDITLLVRGRVNAQIFDATEALFAGNRKMAITFLRKQIRSGDDPHQLLAMYAYQIRVLLRVAGLYFDGGIRDKTAVARELKIHPFVAQKSLGVMQNASKKRLLVAHKMLLEIDRDIKVGKRDLMTALEVFVMEV